VLQVHLSDGQTLRFDLEDERQAAEWLRKARDPCFQSKISGLTLLQNEVQYSFPRPHGFSRVWLFAEWMPADPTRKFKGGERTTGQIDSVRATMMVHLE
jgi:hypothetical protein